MPWKIGRKLIEIKVPAKLLFIEMQLGVLPTKTFSWILKLKMSSLLQSSNLIQVIIHIFCIFWWIKTISQDSLEIQTRKIKWIQSLVQLYRMILFIVIKTKILIFTWLQTKTQKVHQPVQFTTRLWQTLHSWQKNKSLKWLIISATTTMDLVDQSKLPPQYFMPRKSQSTLLTITSLKRIRLQTR